MIPFDQLRSKFGDILREKVPPKSLDKVFAEADRMGRVQARERNRMIIAIYNYLEDNQLEASVTGTDANPVSVVLNVPTGENIQSTK